MTGKNHANRQPYWPVVVTTSIDESSVDGEVAIAAGDLGFEDIAIPVGDLSLVDYKIPFNESESELWRRKPYGENESFISFSFVFFHFVKTLVSYLFNILCVLFI